ncbi:hypothetical protein FACS189429_3450 [Bacteroidia bacterium]|nr:hypothetical protein FACS189429_3450 [Bacteroidia bacterium]
MKQLIFHNHNNVLRFRRWGRAAYSAFRSMNRVVTIGRLVVSVADKAMLKLKNLRLQVSGSRLSNEATDTENLELLNFDVLNLQMELQMLPVVAQKNDVAAAALLYKNNFNNIDIQAIGMKFFHFNRFFIFNF